MKRILCSLLVATLPFGSVLADAPCAARTGAPSGYMWSSTTSHQRLDGAVRVVASNVVVELLPEPLDHVRLRRVGRQEVEDDAAQLAHGGGGMKGLRRLI